MARKREVTAPEIAAVVTGSIGTVVSVVSLGISMATYWRDRAQVRVRLLRGFRVTGGAGSDELVRKELRAIRSAGREPPQDLYMRDPDITWDVIEVVNAGRRPIRIDKLAAVTDLSERPYSTFIHFQSKMLAETESAEWRFDRAAERNGNVIGAVAWDAIGRGWYGGATGPLNRVKLALGLRPFSRR